SPAVRGARLPEGLGRSEGLDPAHVVTGVRLVLEADQLVDAQGRHGAELLGGAGTEPGEDSLARRGGHVLRARRGGHRSVELGEQPRHGVRVGHRLAAPTEGLQVGLDGDTVELDRLLDRLGGDGQRAALVRRPTMSMLDVCEDPKSFSVISPGSRYRPRCATRSMTSWISASAGKDTAVSITIFPVGIRGVETTEVVRSGWATLRLAASAPTIPSQQR